MADKTQNININYKFNTAEIEKAAQSIDKANKATNQLQQSAAQIGKGGFGEGFVTGGGKVLTTLDDMNRRLTQMKENMSSMPAGGKLTAMSQEYAKLQKAIQNTTTSLFGQNKTMADSAKAQERAAKETEKLAKEQAKLAKEQAAATAAAEKANKGIGGMVSAFSALSKFAGLAIIANLTKDLVEMTLEMSTLQGQVEGVERGFVTAFANSGEILSGLREATHGTINDFELMKRSLQATNLGVPVENLAVLFEFAAARAQQTGESVDYLVDSIVRGIGRKSPLVLDNLGISVTALRDKFNGVSIASVSVAEAAKGVTEIAKEQLTKMGGYAKTAETEVKALGTAWENFKIQLAKRVEASWITEFITEAINNAARLATAEQEIRDKREQTHGEITFGQMMDYWKANIKGAEDMKVAIENQIKKEEELKKITSSRLFILKEQMANTPLSERLGDPFQNALKGAVEFKSQMDEIDIVIRLLVAELAKLGDDPKDFMNLAKLRKELEELKRVREEDIEITNTKAYDANKRAQYQLEQRILKIDDVIKWEQQWNHTKEQSAFLLAKEAEELEKMNKAFDKWATKMGEGERNPATGELFNRAGFEAKETLNEEGFAEDLKEELPQEMTAVMDKATGKTVLVARDAGEKAAQEFWARFRLAFRGEGLESDQDMEDALMDLKIGAIDITADQLTSIANMEAESFRARIAKMKDFYDDQIMLAGDNERAKDQFRIAEDRKVERLRKKQFIAEQRAAKQTALINGAAAIVKTFAIYGFTPAAIIAAALQAAMTASQIAIIDRQQPRFAKGVIDYQGKGSGTSDSNTVKISRHESVMTAWETANAGGVLKEIRAKKLDDRVLRNLRESRHPVPVMNDERIIKAIKESRAPDVIEQSGIVFKATKKSDDYISKQRAKSVRI